MRMYYSPDQNGPFQHQSVLIIVSSWKV